MKSYKFLNNVTGWAVFAIAAVVYFATVEPTVSFWDCGEYIAASHNMLIGHPPGAPVYLLIAKFFSLFSFGDVTMVAYMINTLSVFASAFTILFLFWTITYLARKIFMRYGEEISSGNLIATLGAGVVGALAYTFSDTFWFSAVEGEVYALSSLFTALVFWAILKWESIADEKYSNRWLILIAFLMGLSIGVHLLNLLAIPAIVMVYYFKKFPVNRRGVIVASIAAIVLLAAIQFGIISGVVKISWAFDQFFVNSLGLPYLSGMIFHVILLTVVLIAGVVYTMKTRNKFMNSLLTSLVIFLIGIPTMFGGFWISLFVSAVIFIVIYYTIGKNRAVLNTIAAGLGVVFIGYSVFSIILIRSLADPTLDENNPDDPYSLLQYLNREQYGDSPLLYGQYFNAPQTKYDDKDKSDPYIIQRDGKYEVLGYKQYPVFDSKYETIFPRMHSAGHLPGYFNWADIEPGEVYYLNEQGKRTNEPKAPPSFGDNLAFFFNYQVNYMYLRYFLWNFAGRQNDNQGIFGEKDKGNWISGIGFIDAIRLGSQSGLPSSMTDMKSRNTYFFLPLILGLLGLLFHLKDMKNFWVVMLLFFMTGIAIVIYLNQYSPQPRERDYAYAGSFYAFAIWIGLGVLQIYEWIRRKVNSIPMAAVASGLSLVLVPVIMAINNWDDHDRSGRYIARDMAINYLVSCEKNAILFTTGDNDTFPLWYAQEVEGIRKDVRVVNLSLFNTDWYIEQMRRKAYESDALPILFEFDDYNNRNRDFSQFHRNQKNQAIVKPMDLKTVMDLCRGNDRRYVVERNSSIINLLPTSVFLLPINKENALASGTIRQEDISRIEDNLLLSWNTKKRGYLYKGDLMILDILANNNWERPIYFTITSPGDFFETLLRPYCRQEGLVYKLVPYSVKQPQERVDKCEMFDNLINKYKYGNLEDPDIYLNITDLRMISGVQNTFNLLANAYISENKLDSAKIVLDKCLEISSSPRVMNHYPPIELMRGFYMVKDFETGRKLNEWCYTTASEELRYFLKLSEKDRKEYERSISIAIMKLWHAKDIALEFEDIEYAKQVVNAYNEFAVPFGMEPDTSFAKEHAVLKNDSEGRALPSQHLQKFSQ